MTETISANSADRATEQAHASPEPQQITLEDAPGADPAYGGDVQARLFETAQTYGPTAPPQNPALSDARRTEIDTFLSENANARYGIGPLALNDVGGTRVGEALTGEADALGTLSNAERAYLAEGAVAAWAQTGNTTNLSEAVGEVRGNNEAAAALARALATPSADTARLHTQGIPTISSPEANAFHARAVDAAVELDPATTIEAFAGVEDRLASVAMFRMDRSAQKGLLDAVADGRITGDAADRLVTGMFVHAERSDFETGLFTGADETLRQPMADALAMVTHPGTDAAATAQRELLAQRLGSILSSEGGRKLLMNENVRPEQRLWSLERVTSSPDWTADILTEGWQSDIVTTAFAEQTADQFAARDPGGEVLRGDALRNMVGTALGQQPDQLPGGQETPEETAARLAEGLDYGYFSDESPTAEIARRIEAATHGDPYARVSVVPITVTSNEFGVAQIPVFRIDRSDGSTAFVDNEGGTYRDLEHWEDKNELPPGRMVAAEGLDLHNDLASPENTRRVIDTFSERAGDIGDKVALGVGIGAGVALATIAIVGSGGAATPFLLAGAGAAGGWTATRAGSELYDDHQRGHDILDWSNPENRSRWLEVAAGTLSVGAIGSGMRAVSMGQQASQGLTRFAAVTALAADGVDIAAMGDQAFQMANNWDQMSNGDRAMGLLNMAFYGGMAAASTRAGGLDPRDMGSFQRMDNTFRTGTPYPMTQTPGLRPGEVRVSYDMDPAGLPTNVRIETGGGPVDADMLRLHTRAARQIEQSSGLQARLADILGNETPAPGTAPWEARIEIDKINAEARLVARDLTARDLTPDARSALETRQRELDQALRHEETRLTAALADPNGFIASPRSLNTLLDVHSSTGAIIRGLPDGTSPARVPDADAAANIDYGRVNDAGQAQGIEATITADTLDTGSHANSSIRPPGFVHGITHNHSRGHLLARMLGGSGDDPANLVTLFQRNTNSPVMRDFEDAVYSAVEAGEVVNYNVTPIYDGDGLPTSLAISARGSDGFELDITLINRDDS